MRLRVRVGVASRAVPGELVCGDQLDVVTAGARTMTVLADGLGHGADAASAAKAAVTAVRASSRPSLVEVMHDVHAALKPTRGAVVTLLRIDAERGLAEHVSVGNIELTGLTQVPLRVVPNAGVVGSRIRKLVAMTNPLHAGDVLVLHTDGISRRFQLERYRGLEPQPLAETLLAEHAKEHDDAACIVIRV